MSDRRLLDIQDGLEWNLVIRETYQVQRIDDRSYNPIPPRSLFIENSSVIMIGLRNSKAEAHWYLGAWLEMRLPLSPSSTTEFMALVTASNRRLRLGGLNLVILPKLMPSCLIELKFPYWHEEMLVEVWRYDGRDVGFLEALSETNALIVGNQP